MTIADMIKALENAVGDIDAVISDLKDAADGGMNLSDVNLAYSYGAVARIQRVTEALRAA